jgi:lysophospholipase L1-like esterase
MHRTLRATIGATAASIALILGLAVPAHAAPGDDLVVIGDSFSAGYNGYGVGAKGWPAIVADRYDLNLKLNAVVGTGYVKTTGGLANSYANRWRIGLTASTDVVIVAGSQNDKNETPSAVYSKVRAVDNAIATVAPNATVVFIGPMWGATDPTWAQPIEDAVRSAAAAQGARFIDGSHWMSKHPTLIYDNHPTDGGHAVIAKYAGDALAVELSR